VSLINESQNNMINVFSRTTKNITQIVDDVSMKLKDLKNALLPVPCRIETSNTFSSLDMSIDDAAHILQNLRKFFGICSHVDQRKLLTMFPSTWGKDRVSNWFGCSEHQARCSLAIKSTSGMFSNVIDNRGNKVLDDEIEQLVQIFLY
jgi:hypothetical protein